MTPEEIELEMLRDFYQKWKGLHSLENTPDTRTMMEQAAQNLVEAADTLDNFYNPDLAVIQ